MATLQKLRNTGPLLIIIVGLALFAFIAGDAWRILQPHQGTQSVGTVNGEEISAIEYQEMVEEYMNIVKLLRNNENLSEEEQAQAKDEVWNTYVRTQIIKKEADKLGLKVTDAELESIIKEGTDPILQQTPFYNPQTRKFDSDALNQFLSEYDRYKDDPNMAMQYQGLYDYWLFVEKSIMDNALAQKYQSLVVNSIISNPVVAQNNYDLNNNTYDVEIKAVPYTAVADSDVTVEDSDIKKLYNEQKEQYKQLAESRNIKYVSFKVTPSPADRAELNKELTEYVDSLKADNADYATLARISYSTVPYTTLAWAKDAYPEEVQLRLDSIKPNQVVGPIYNQSDDSYTVFKYLSSETVADSIRYKVLYVAAKDEAATQALTDSLLDVLKGGADFKEVAKKYGQEGEEVWLTSANYEGMRVQENDVEFLNTLFNANTNQYAVMSIEGLPNKIIYMVTEKRNPETKYNAVVLRRNTQFSSETYNEAYNKFSQFVASCKNVEDLESKAEEFGYRVMEQNNIFTYAHNIANVAGTRNALRWIFSEAKEGNVSPLYECGNNDNLLVVALTGVNEKGYVEMGTLNVPLHTQALKDKKAEKIIAEMQGKNFDEIGKMSNVKADVVKRINFASPAFINITSSSEAVISAAVAKMEVGEVSAPIQGRGGVYVIKLIAKNAKENNTYNAQAEANNIMMLGQRSSSILLNDLYEKAEVTDNRYLFF